MNNIFFVDFILLCCLAAYMYAMSPVLKLCESKCFGGEKDKVNKNG